MVMKPEVWGPALDDVVVARPIEVREGGFQVRGARGAVGNFLLIDQANGNTLAAGFVGKRLRGA